jgi:hypothetical protein
MGNRIAQVAPLERFPSGDAWTVGVLTQSPNELAERFGLSFEVGIDDLDSYKLAAIAEPQVGQFWLFAHDQAPFGGTDVMVDSAVSRDEALCAVWRALHLDVRAFAWLSPYEVQPSGRADSGAPPSAPVPRGSVILCDSAGNELARWTFETGGPGDNVWDRLLAREREIEKLEAEVALLRRELGRMNSDVTGAP